MESMDQTVSVEQAVLIAIISGFGGGVIGALGSLLGTWLLARYQRMLDRDSELRRWRLERLEPTLNLANRTVQLLSNLDSAHSKMYSNPTPEARAAFMDLLFSELRPFRDQGHLVAMARNGSRPLGESLIAFFDTHADCIEHVVDAAERNWVALRLGLPRISIQPPEEVRDRLGKAITNLNHEIERYAFGEVD